MTEMTTAELLSEISQLLEMNRQKDGHLVGSIDLAMGDMDLSIIPELCARLEASEAALEAANTELAHTKQMLNSALFFNNGGVGKTLAELGLEG